MKSIIFIIVILTNYQIIYSQDEGSGYFPGEMYLGTVNVNPPTQVLEFYTIAQGTVWAGSNTPRSYWISNLYNNDLFIPENNVSNIYYWKGWDFVTDITSNPPYYIPKYAYGLYKIYTNHSSEHFFLDFRDDRYGYYLYYQPPSYGHDIDLWIKYDASIRKFYCASRTDYPFQVINNGQVIGIWEIKQKGIPSTNQFPNFWQNCLSVVNDGNNHPRLVWGINPDYSNNYYKIYKKKGSASFSYFASCSTTTFIDTDEDLIEGPYQANEGIAQYKVTTVGYPGGNTNQPLTESGYTNSVSARIDAGPLEKRVVSGRADNFNLLHNFQNPFNPTTKIIYALTEGRNVKVVITNTLGEEVKVLDEGFKEAGEYSAVFDSENLPSGIYICSLITNQGIMSNKMLLLR